MFIYKRLYTMYWLYDTYSWGAHMIVKEPDGTLDPSKGAT